MYWTAKRDGTINQKNGTENGTREKIHILEPAPPDAACPSCGAARTVVADSEVCCTGCGAVLGVEYQQAEAAPASKLNLYQAEGVGTARVALECARHIHEPSRDMSRISSICAKLDMPMHAAKEAYTTYVKIIRSKQKGRAVPRGGHERPQLNHPAVAGAPAGPEWPKNFTKAHVAAFSIHLACNRNSLPRSNDAIIEAVLTNFRSKKNFTMLRAYSLVELTARDLDISMEFDKASYHLRLLLKRLQDEIGPGEVYNRVSALAFRNLEMVLKGRDDERARRSFEIARRSVGLHVQV